MTDETTAQTEVAYQEYLATWRREYGDADSAEVEYWQFGESRTMPVHKLSREAFEDASERLSKIGKELETIYQRPDYYTGDMPVEIRRHEGKLLETAFPIEMTLLY